MASDLVDKILTQWHRERPDLDVSPMGVIGRMGRLAKHLERSTLETFSEFDLKPGEFDVLATLRRSGCPFQLSPTELFSTLMVSSGTMTYRLDRLAKAGLVERVADPRDGRGMLTQLTSEGINLVDRAVEAYVASEHRILSSLEVSDREALARLLRKLCLTFEE